MGQPARCDRLWQPVQAATGQTVELAHVDQGNTGDALAAARRGIHLEAIKPPTPKRGFVPWPRRWMIERRAAWASQFRWLANDDERLPEGVEGLHFLAFVALTLLRLVHVVAQSP